MAQLGDVIIHRARVHHRVVAPDGIEQLFACDGFAAMIEVGLLEQSARALNRLYIEQFAARAEQNRTMALPKFLEVSLAN